MVRIYVEDPHKIANKVKYHGNTTEIYTSAAGCARFYDILLVLSVP